MGVHAEMREEGSGALTSDPRGGSERRNLRLGDRGIPGVLGREVKKERRDTPFIVLISLLCTLTLARAFVLITGAANTTTETPNYVGKNLIIGGYHIHHFFYGFGLICIAAWLAIQYPTRHLGRIAAVLFGGGLGLTVDEMGYFLGGQVNYFDRTTYFIALVTVLILLSAFTFRSFRRAAEGDLRALAGRRPRGIVILAILQVLASLALLLVGLAVMAAGGLVVSPDLLPGTSALALGATLILLGLISFVIAGGLWSLKPWARTLGIIFAIGALVAGIASMATGNYDDVVSVIIDLLLLWYLTRPGVKAAFTPAPGSGAPA